MLKKDLKILKVLLGRLFTGFNYFKLTSEHKVIVKNHWWSFTQYIYNLKDLLVNVIPNTIKDPEVSRAYGDAINEYINTNDMSKALQSVYDIYITYVQNEKTFKGICLERVSLAKRLNSWITSLKALRSRSLLGRHSEITFITVEETLQNKLKAIINTVGRVSTGNPKFDAQFLEINRYAMA